MRRIGPLLVVGGMLCIASLLFLTRSGHVQRGAEHASGAAGESATLEALREEISSLRAEQRRLELKIQRILNANPSASTPASEGVDTPSEADVEAQTKELARNMDDIIKGEARDEAWGQAVSRQLQAMTSAGAFSGTTFEETECKNTMCRIGVLFESPEATASFFERNVDYPPFNHESMVVRDGADDELRVSIYVARDGHQLPLDALAGR